MKFLKNNFLILILLLIFVLIYIEPIGSYALLDVDETRYVTMARDMFNTKDFLTLSVNGDYFFEKPPLFFWLECLSFKIFGQINEFTARIPVVLLSLLPLCLLFNLSCKVNDNKFAFLNCAVLLTSLEYILITRMAILDSILTSFTASSVICYFYTFFVKEQNKKYFWLLTYAFSGLAVLAKGVPGLAIPALVILVCTAVFKTWRETFKYMPAGVTIFLLISLPWHIIMINKYGLLFIDEYIIKHHILRYLGSKVINRSHGMFFYFFILLWGLLPYAFQIIFKFTDDLRNKKLFKKTDISNDYEKFILLNKIAAGIIFLFFTSSSTKLPTYILPIYPFTAVLTGGIWYEYITGGLKSVKNSVITFNLILILVFLTAPFLCLFVTADIYSYIKPVQIAGIVIIGIYLPFGFLSLKKDERFNQFLCIVFFMTSVFCIITPYGYKLDYAFGQNDLMKFADMAKRNGYTVSSYEQGRRYSLIYYSGLKKVNFYQKNENALQNELKKKDNFLVMRNKYIEKRMGEFEIIEKGKKYSIVKGKE